MTLPGRPSQYHYFLFNKPYGVLAQFTPEAGHRSLRNFGPFPKDIYPVGRLDVDSEGLILLTNDNRIKHRLSTPKFSHERTYLVQVENIPEEEALQRLREGVVIEGKRTLPSRVHVLGDEPDLTPRPTPVRFRRNVPTSWLELTLTEGRNRQVRKMTAAVGHPTLRLVRTHISFLSLEGLSPGESRSLTPKETARLVKEASHSGEKHGL